MWWMRLHKQLNSWNCLKKDTRICHAQLSFAQFLSYTLRNLACNRKWMETAEDFPHIFSSLTKKCIYANTKCQYKRLSCAFLGARIPQIQNPFRLIGIKTNFTTSLSKHIHLLHLLCMSFGEQVMILKFKCFNIFFQSTVGDRELCISFTKTIIWNMQLYHEVKNILNLNSINEKA